MSSKNCDFSNFCDFSKNCEKSQFSQFLLLRAFLDISEFAINISFIKPRYVYNLVFGRNSETNGVGKQH